MVVLMPILVATFTSHTPPINSAPDAVPDKPLGQEINYFNLWQEKQGISFGDFLAANAVRPKASSNSR